MGCVDVPMAQNHKKWLQNLGELVMKSGSKVGFGLQSSGFYGLITIRLPSGFPGFANMNILNVGFRVGFSYLSPRSGRV